MNEKATISLKILNLFVFVGLATAAWATPWTSQASDHHSPRTASLGGAGHAGPILNDAVFLNPSYASFLPTYSLGLNYLFFDSDRPPGREGRSYSVSIQDGRSELFQAGAAYTLREDGAFVHVGASKSFLQRFGAGLGAKFFFGSGGRASGRDMVFSTTGVVTEEFQSALIIDNLLETTDSQNRDLYREFILGTKLNIQKIILVYVDPHYTPNRAGGLKWGHEAGLEFVAMSDLLFRVGHFRNANVPFIATRGRGFGLGAGLIAPRISLDYGLQRMLEPYTAIAHLFGATMYF